MKKSTKDPKKKSQGRPSLYNEAYDSMLLDHMKKGYSYESFAGIVDVCIDTLYEWESKHESFAEAKKIGFAKSRYKWEQLGMTGMLGLGKTKDGKRSGSFSAGTWIFNMKNRFNWRDKHEHVGKDGEQLSVTALFAMEDADDESTS